MIFVTLNAIRSHGPCQDGYEQLLKHLGKTKADNEPVSLLTILESNGLNDALWCLRALPEEWSGRVRHLACDFAESVLHFVPEGEDRPRRAIETARRYADGLATKEELADARAAAWDAAGDAAWAAWDATRGAACDAAWAAMWEVACDAACDAARDQQEAIFRAWIKKHAPQQEAA